MDATERERRAADRRIDKLEESISNVVKANADEFDHIHKEHASLKEWASAHDAKDEERWTSNTDKWAENIEKHRESNMKLNAIIGTSVVTLLTVVGFFASLWMDRMEEKQQRQSSIPAVHDSARNQ